MKERIKRIMDDENLSSTEFADKLQISRAVVSHILNGRNNPSLDVVSKILQELPHINSEWLINGVGRMYKEGFDMDSIPRTRNLFTQEATSQPAPSTFGEKNKENRVPEPNLSVNDAVSKGLMPVESSVRKITQIIIYYDDNTFETLTPK